MIDISAVICTRNNVGLLRAALVSLCDQALEPDKYEVIVVDNGSTDATGETVRSYARNRSSPVVKYVPQPRAGLAHARNAGYFAASGTWVAYMDDDARAQPDCMAAILHAANQDNEAVAIAGRVMPGWEVAPPTWWNSHFDRSVSVVDWGNEAHRIRLPEWMCGANYAVKRQVLCDLGGHDPTFGRQPGTRYGGEEIELQIRIERLGLPILYTPAASVVHLIPKERLTRRYYLQQQLWAGRTQYLIDLKHAPESRTRTALMSLARSPRSYVLAAGGRIRGDPQAEWGRMGQVYWATGYIRQAISLSASRAT